MLNDEISEKIINDGTTSTNVVTHERQKNAICTLNVSKKDSIWHAAKRGNIFKISKLVKLDPENVDAQNGEGETPLWVAACKGRVETIQTLKALGANVDAPDKNGVTPVWIAAANGQVHAIQVLKSLGANIDAPDKNGATPVWIAAANGHVHSIKTLKALGANIDASDKNGATPVWVAAANGHVHSIKTLKVLGANIDTRDKKSVTPILIAARNGHCRAIDALKTLYEKADIPADLKRQVYTTLEETEKQKGFRKRLLDIKNNFNQSHHTSGSPELNNRSMSFFELEKKRRNGEHTCPSADLSENFENQSKVAFKKRVK